MEDLLKYGLTIYGPLAIGWIVAAALGWRLWFDTSKVIAQLKCYQDLIMSFHSATVDNTRVMERLAMLIEERSRIQQRNLHSGPSD